MKREFTEVEARELGESVGIDFASISLAEFQMGLGVELEHGAHDSETYITHDNLEMTAKIAWAHLKEIPDYYTRLKKMEIEAGA